MTTPALQVGDAVFYHPILGEPHDGVRRTVRQIGNIPSAKNPVAWVTGKAGCVLIEALSRAACRRCGCTEDDCSSCIAKTGEPCHWVEDDLCSACQELPA